MICIRATLVAAAVVACASWSTQADASLILSPDGATVSDTVEGVTWLANANLAASNTFGLSNCQANGNVQPCVNTSGSMTYQSAQAWIGNMRLADYSGHSNWQLPATQTLTFGCTATGPHGESFGYGCSGSPLGSVYFNGLGLSAPSSVVGPTQGTIGAFTNLQPNIYWTATAAAASNNGFHTFSFATGWRGANQGANPSDPSKGPIANFFYVLPMLHGQVNVPGTVFDPAAGVTWLADGNIAAQNTFGLPLCSGLGSASSAPCVNANGTMTQTSAQAFIAAMNNFVNPDTSIGYLHQRNWELPPSSEAPNCLYSACAANAAEDPLASLYYNFLGLDPGSSVADPSTASNSPFFDLQPNLYWSCQAANDHGSASLSACSPNPQCSPLTDPNPCANDMEWSFNFIDGFQGTDNETNDLFVTAYYVDAVPEPLTLSLFGAGIAGAAAMRRRKNKSA